MEKKMNNKGFSLVELIIVVAIMAVLIGVLAPAYLQYVEKSKKTADCTTIGGVMDAIEVAAADPNVTWTTGGVISVTIPVSGAATISGDTNCSAAETKVKEIVDVTGLNMTSGWGAASFTATKNSNGFVVFTPSAPTVAQLQDVSKVLAARFE